MRVQFSIHIHSFIDLFERSYLHSLPELELYYFYLGLHLMSKAQIKMCR